MPSSDPQSPIPNPSPRSLPRWLKRNVPKGNANHFTAKLIGQLGLQTVCDHAKCPNRMECYVAEDGHVPDPGRHLHARAAAFAA